MWIVIGVIVMIAFGAVVYKAEKDRYCPKCGGELKAHSYKKSQCERCRRVYA